MVLKKFSFAIEFYADKSKAQKLDLENRDWMPKVRNWTSKVRNWRPKYRYWISTVASWTLMVRNWTSKVGS